MKPKVLTYNERVKCGIIGACLTGSALVHGIEYNDVDYVLLFEDQVRLDEFLWMYGGKSNSDDYEADGMDMCRDGQYNYLCTTLPSVYWRWVAFSGVLATLQLKDKVDRKALAIACTEWQERLTPDAI